MDLEEIKRKLRVNNDSAIYIYFINNVAVGLENILKYKEVKREKEKFNQLEQLSKEVNGLTFHLREVIPHEQLTAMRIADQATEIINSIDFD